MQLGRLWALNLVCAEDAMAAQIGGMGALHRLRTLPEVSETLAPGDTGAGQAHIRGLPGGDMPCRQPDHVSILPGSLGTSGRASSINERCYKGTSAKPISRQASSMNSARSCRSWRGKASAPGFRANSRQHLSSSRT
jgi:hypothetical protein